MDPYSLPPELAAKIQWAGNGVLTYSSATRQMDAQPAPHPRSSRALENQLRDRYDLDRDTTSSQYTSSSRSRYDQASTAGSPRSSRYGYFSDSGASETLVGYDDGGYGSDGDQSGISRSTRYTGDGASTRSSRSRSAAHAGRSHLTPSQERRVAEWQASSSTLQRFADDVGRQVDAHGPPTPRPRHGGDGRDKETTREVSAALDRLTINSQRLYDQISGSDASSRASRSTRASSRRDAPPPARYGFPNGSDAASFRSGESRRRR